MIVIERVFSEWFCLSFSRDARWIHEQVFGFHVLDTPFSAAFVNVIGAESEGVYICFSQLGNYCRELPITFFNYSVTFLDGKAIVIIKSKGKAR